MSSVTKSNSRSLSPLWTGLVWSIASMIVLTLVLSLLLWLSNMKESGLSSWVYVIHAVSLVIGGFAAGRNGGSRGWYHGGLLGIVYSLIVLVIGYLALDASFGWNVLLLLLGGIVFGALGGIIGVNTKK